MHWKIIGTIFYDGHRTSVQMNEVEGIQGAGPQNFILGGWLPQNQQAMMIILPHPILPSPLLPLPPFDSYKDQSLIRLLLVILFLYLVL
jgi:hypothetical protein